MDEWLNNIRLNPRKGIRRQQAGARPSTAASTCRARLIYAGDDAWNGILDTRRPAPARRRFPLYATSRIVAGAPIEGGIYNCALQAGGAGGGRWHVRAVGAECRARSRSSKQIFPEGVCDYSRPDQARP